MAQRDESPSPMGGETQQQTRTAAESAEHSLEQQIATQSHWIWSMAFETSPGTVTDPPQQGHTS